jgi:type IX secretion system PorP/SprF family membrane protein
MKKIITLIFFLISIVGVKLYSQQNPLYTQFMFNPYVINPALAGTHNYYQIRSNHRFQWTGIKDAPITNTLSIYGPLEKQPMGIGGYIFSDVIGPESKTGIYGTYAYNYPINDRIKVSMGLTAGFLQYKIDGTKINFYETEPIYSGGIESKFIPDANVGVYVYSSMFHVGFAANQLINNKLNFGTDPTGLSKLKSHFYLTGGYTYYINRDWMVEPTLILKQVFPTPPQLDFASRIIYQKMAWLGVSFRTSDAVSVLLGYAYEDKLYIGYSYDIGINDIRGYNSGSHEVMIGFKFNDLK